MLFWPSAWKPVEITVGSKVREDCDGSSGGTALVVRICDGSSLSLMQSTVIPGESVLGEARHLRSREYLRSCTTLMIRKDAHQAGVAVRKHEATLDTTSKLIVDASYLVRLARRECVEGPELGTDGGR